MRSSYIDRDTSEWMWLRSVRDLNGESELVLMYSCDGVVQFMYSSLRGWTEPNPYL